MMTIDDFLPAPKKLIAQRLHDAMTWRQMTRAELVRQMGTTHVVVNRLLDPSDLRVSLTMLFKASRALRVPLVCVE